MVFVSFTVFLSSMFQVEDLCVLKHLKLMYVYNVQTSFSYVNIL